MDHHSRSVGDRGTSTAATASAAVACPAEKKGAVGQQDKVSEERLQALLW